MIARLVSLAAGHARLVAVAGVALAAGAIVFVATHFSLSTSEDDLLSPKLPYRQAEAALAREFPNLDAQIVVVVDGATPELAEQSAQALEGRLSADPRMFPSVRRPDAGPFWSREGLLFETAGEVKSSMDRLIAAEPFLGPMAADPSLRGLMSSLNTALQGVQTGQAQLSAMATPMGRLADALERLETGKDAVFSWQNLIGGADPRLLRKLILVNPGRSASIPPTASPCGSPAACRCRTRSSAPWPIAPCRSRWWRWARSS